MADMISGPQDYVKPAKLTDKATGEVYTLDFSRESVRWAEGKGFKINEVSVFPVTRIPEFFFYSFRMHHPKMARANTDKLLEKMGGMSPALIERLFQLYAQAGYTKLLAEDNEVVEKNPDVALDLD